MSSVDREIKTLALMVTKKCRYLEDDCEGFLITIDGTIIHWGEGRGTMFTILFPSGKKILISPETLAVEDESGEEIHITDPAVEYSVEKFVRNASDPFDFMVLSSTEEITDKERTELRKKLGLD